jgi:hypothetical protein
VAGGILLSSGSPELIFIYLLLCNGSLNEALPLVLTLRT